MSLSKEGKDVVKYLEESIGEQKVIDLDDFECWYDEALEEYDYCNISESKNDLINHLSSTLNVTIE